MDVLGGAGGREELLTVVAGGGGFEGGELGGAGGRECVGVGVEALELVEVLLEGLGSEGISELGAGRTGGLLEGAGGGTVEVVVVVGTGSEVEVLCKG